MTPVLQTDYRAPGGNCFQACVASILDLPLASVPHFLKGSDGGMWTQDHWDVVRRFAEQYGRMAVWLDPDKPEDLPFIQRMNDEGLYAVATGKAFPSSEYGHCVVWQRGQLAHDPMGDGHGLASEPWLYILFPQA